jgi:BirA family transcriptional regulator, biotin operon repressor / biotin---[acetyl-CoA-carboxylase] ligase
MSPPDRLIAAQLHAALGQCLIGQRIIVLESTRSTNDFLRQMLTPELPEGIVVFAEAQTAGRGRHGRHWASASHQGLWFSLLLRPRLSLLESARLTTWAAQAVATVIRDETGLKSTIKPPNDVYVGPRKVAGVLVETVAKRGPEYDAIVGLGLNLNQALQDFPGELRARAGSLAMALGHPVDRSSFAIAILRELERTREAHLALQASAPMSASH